MSALEPADPRTDVHRPLTIILVSYNCKQMLDRCLDSIRCQAGVDLRVLVVDNASSDGTPEMVQRDHSWVSGVMMNATNVGFGAACNQGLLQADGGHVLMLNPDTVLPPGALSSCLHALEARPSVGMIGCKLVQESGEVDRACRRSIPNPATSLAYLLRVDRLAGLRNQQRYVRSDWYDDEGEAEAINGAFMLVRGSALSEVGGFDERFWMYGEDLDWCVRFREAGWPVYYWPEVVVLHIKAGTSGRIRTLKVNREFHRAMWLFYDKHQAAAGPRTIRAAVGAGILAHFLASATLNACRRPLASRQALREAPMSISAMEEGLRLTNTERDSQE